MGTFLTEEINWEAGYYVFGLAGIALAILAMIFVKDPKHPNIFPSNNTRSYRSSDTMSLIDDGDDLVEKKKKSWGDVWNTTKEVFLYWRTTPAIVAICIASAFRNGAGYVWAYYSGVFFADKWESDPDHDGTCWYSNTNSSWSGGCGGAPECCTDDYPYCVSGSCSDLSEFPWHNEGMSSTQFESYISWIPLIGGGMGAMVGGHLSDILVAKYGPESRLLILSISNFIAAPIIASSLYLDYPWCFLVWIASGFIGEAWIGTAIASIMDLTPAHLTVFSTSIYMFFLEIIGGSLTTLVFVPYV